VDAPGGPGDLREVTVTRPAICDSDTVTPTVVYVHGIGNQPVADALKRQWDEALFGHAMGDRTRMAYWVNRRRYPRPVEPGRVLPLPAGLADWITAQVSLAVLPDVHDFLYRPHRRRFMERRIRDQLDRVHGSVVVIAHSQGSMIAYDVLRKLRRTAIAVPLLVTLGSPLGLAEIQHVLRRWSRRRVLPVPRCVERWVNVADRLDAVAADPRLANDFSPPGFIQDVVRPGVNALALLGPHSATGYLQAPEVRRAVGALLALHTA
jgi:hypothetical protein